MLSISDKYFGTEQRIIYEGKVSHKVYGDDGGMGWNTNILLILVVISSVWNEE